MKTEQEILKHRDSLLALAGKPCTCPTLVASILCAARRERMLVTAGLLTWVLGENEEYERIVEEVADMARR